MMTLTSHLIAAYRGERSATSNLGLQFARSTSWLSLAVVLSMASCTSSKSDQAASSPGTTAPVLSTVTPNAAPSTFEGPGKTDAGTLGRNPESSDGAAPTIGLNVPRETLYIIPPLEPSPAELAVLAPPSSVRIGSIDNDVKAAAPDTKLPEFERPAAPITSPPTTLPLLTVPDLGLDPASAERQMVAASWPADVKVLLLGDADTAGNAAANAFAGDARLKAALRSGSARLLRKGENTAMIAVLVIFDPAKLGTSVTDEVVRALGGSGVPSITTFEGKPAVTVELTNGLFQLVVIDGDRLVSVGGGKPDEALIRSALQAVLAGR
jgi:hypothetical protein